MSKIKVNKLILLIQVNIWTIIYNQVNLLNQKFEDKNN